MLHDPRDARSMSQRSAHVKRSWVTHVTLCMIALCHHPVTSAEPHASRSIPDQRFRSRDLASAYNAYYMATLSALAYSDLSLAQKSYRALGLKACSGRESIKLIDRTHDNTTAHLSVDGQRVFLIIRGTDDLADFWQNMKLSSVKRARWGDVHIHKGFSEMSDSFMKATDLPKLLRSCAGTLGSRAELYLGGHSLGGALANIIAAELHAHNIQVHGVYTYGAPRVGGTSWVKHFTQLFPKQSFQWRNLHDPVARIPKGPLAQDQYLDLPSLTLGEAGSVKIWVENLNPFDGKGSFSYHNKKKYAFDLWESAKRGERLPSALSPRALLNIGKIASYCSSHQHCGPDQYCATVGRNRCKTKKPQGAMCLKDISCTSGRCAMGKCQPSVKLRVSPSAESGE